MAYFTNRPCHRASDFSFQALEAFGVLNISVILYLIKLNYLLRFRGNYTNNGENIGKFVLANKV